MNERERFAVGFTLAAVFAVIVVTYLLWRKRGTKEMFPRIEPGMLPTGLKTAFAGLADVPIYYIGYVTKLNKVGRRQERLLVVLSECLFNCTPNGDIQRCLRIESIDHIKTCPREASVFLSVPTEYNMVFEMPFVAYLAGCVSVR